MTVNIIFPETYIKDLSFTIGSLKTELRIVLFSSCDQDFLLKGRLLFLDTVLQGSVKCSSEVQYHYSGKLHS